MAIFKESFSPLHSRNETIANGVQAHSSLNIPPVHSIFLAFYIFRHSPLIVFQMNTILRF